MKNMRKDMRQHEWNCKHETEPKFPVEGEECFRRMTVFTNYFVAKVFNISNSLLDFAVLPKMKTCFAGGEIHINIVIPAFAEFAGDSQSAVGTIHAFYL